MRLDKTTKIALPIVIVLVLAGIILGVKQCSAQTAGEFSMTFSYGANVDEQFTRTKGPDWVKQMKDELREHWQNRKNEARDAFIKNQANLFDFDNVKGLTKADIDVLKALRAKQDAYEIEQKRIADSVLNAQEIGLLDMQWLPKSGIVASRDYRGYFAEAAERTVLRMSR